jgi:hypothetical protein
VNATVTQSVPTFQEITFTKPSEGMARESAERWAAFAAGIRDERAAASRAEADIKHVGGVTWYDAPKPRRWHRCKVQTSGWIGFDLVERCACGAIRRNGRGGWFERNSRTH